MKFILILLTTVEQSNNTFESIFKHPLIDKVLAAIIGVVFALITDYFTKRRREKKRRINEGMNELKKVYYEKLSDPRNKLENINFQPNRDFELYLKKNKLSITKIEEDLIEGTYSDIENAQDRLKNIKNIIDKYY